MNLWQEWFLESHIYKEDPKVFFMLSVLENMKIKAQASGNNNVTSFVCVCETDILCWGKSIIYKCLKRKCWGKYLDLRRMKYSFGVNFAALDAGKM
jgi:hypothetical protein